MKNDENAANQFVLWGKGIDYEIDFWREWFATRGGEWPGDFARRVDPDQEIEPSFMDLIAAVDPGAAKILDVGSGPVSILGKTFHGIRLDITATDPLADFYANIAARHHVERSIPVVKAFAEDLASFFAPNSFDLVHCQNALDHSFEPVRAIFHMLKIVKAGGVVLLRHLPNEAENENYVGFHQWNFDVEEGSFVIWNRHQRINVNDLVNAFADVRAVKSGGVSVVIRKRQQVPDSPFLDTDARVRSLLDAVMDLSHRLAKANEVPPLSAPAHGGLAGGAIEPNGQPLQPWWRSLWRPGSRAGTRK